MLDAALHYAERDWAVFPVAPRAKEPVIPKWQGGNGCSDATTDAVRIRAWWSRYPDANIGLNLGLSGVLAIDVDPRHGGGETWAKLRQEHAIDDSTVVSLTGSGGTHLLYSDNGTDPAALKGELGHGVDVKRGNAYIVVPPSVHPNGHHYEWDVGGHPDDMAPAPLPSALLALLTRPPAREPEPYTGPPPDAAKVQAALDSLDPGIPSYNDWLRVLMAIHAALPGPDGLAMAKAWADGYEGEVEHKWRGFKAEGNEAGRVDIGTLFYLANQAHAAETPPEAPPEEPAPERKRPTTAEYVKALTALGYDFRLNVCNDVVEVNNEPMSDVLRSKIRSQMRDQQFWRVNVIEDAWTAHAYDCQYHPVREFLDGLTWDGGDHLAALGRHIEDRDSAFSVFFKRWAIGAVARAYEADSTQNRMLILDGEQGIGKTYLVRWLAKPAGRPELFIEGPIAPDDKDNLIRLITAWVWEVAELGSTTRRSDRDALKYFLSLQQVTVRKPYGHYDLVKPALASFIGTVNNAGGFLDDPTGYRRFMAVHLEAIDWRYTDLDPAQIWAQAKALYQDGEPWMLTAHEQEIAEYLNLQYEVQDPLDDLIGRLYEVTDNPANFAATVDIRDRLNEHNWRMSSPRAEAMAIAATLKKWGLEEARQAVEGKRERGWQKLTARE